MIVLDASAVVDWLLQTPAGQRIEQRIYARKDTLHTVSFARCGVCSGPAAPGARGDIGTQAGRGGNGRSDRASCHSVCPCRVLASDLAARQNLSAYDAAYIALAEELKAPLITRDQKIAAAPGHSATIEVF